MDDVSSPASHLTQFKHDGYLLPRLNQTYRQLLGDHELLTADHKQLKGELNQAKLEHTWLDADYSKLKKEFQQLDITTTKLTNQCEVLPVCPSVRPACLSLVHLFVIYLSEVFLFLSFHLSIVYLASYLEKPFAQVEENSAGHLAKHTHIHT